MTVRGMARRLDRLTPRDGSCPECGGRANTISTVYIGRATADTKRLYERCEEREQPGRPRCETCGMYFGVEFVREEA